MRMIEEPMKKSETGETRLCNISSRGRRSSSSRRKRRRSNGASTTAAMMPTLLLLLSLLLFSCLLCLASGFQSPLLLPIRSSRARPSSSSSSPRWKMAGSSSSSSDPPLFYDDFGDFFDKDSGSNDKEDKRDEPGEEEDDADDEDDDGEYLNPDALGDWRELRRTLQLRQQQSPSSSSPVASSATSDSSTGESTGNTNRIAEDRASGSAEEENAALLETQCTELAREYRERAWAHPTPTPEVGGLVVRMPLEFEIFRGFHRRNRSSSGSNERGSGGNSDGSSKRLVPPWRLRTGELLAARHKLGGDEPPSYWHPLAHRFVEQSMLKIAHLASKQNGQIDASQLDGAGRELLQLYLDHQETWQEVCLVLSIDEQQQRDDPNNRREEKSLRRLSDTAKATATATTKTTTTTLVLNRPMALKLTPNLAQLVLFGDQRGTTMETEVDGGSAGESSLLARFLQAFGSECAVYLGGPDFQDQPAEIVHGISNLEGSVEICPHAGIYVGGLDAAIQGVLDSKYKPMDFRFFLGRHHYDASNDVTDNGNHNDDDGDNAGAETVLPLHAQVLLGKYQPVACSRSLVLKQCISLPKPLWHEVLEMAGGELAEISRLELGKRERVRFQILDDDDDEVETVDVGEEEYDDDDDDDDEIVDELSELERFDDEDEDEYF